MTTSYGLRAGGLPIDALLNEPEEAVENLVESLIDDAPVATEPEEAVADGKSKR